MNLNQLECSLTIKRKKQIEKILQYGQDILGLKVKLISSKIMGSDAGGYIPPFESGCKAEVEIASGYKGLNLIYILLHEFGHHMDYLKRGCIQNEEDAYDYYPSDASEAPCPEKYAKLVRHTEEQAIKYAKELAFYLDLKLPKYSTLKDEILTRELMELILVKGFTTQEDRVRIRKYASNKAREILNVNKRKSNKSIE